MKRNFISVAFALAISSTVLAAPAPVSFSFSAVPLMTFAQATYKNLLGRDFVISSDLVNMDKKITISVKALPSEKIPAFIDGLLASQGIKANLKDGIYYLDVLKPSSDPVAQVVDASASPGQPAAPGKLASPVDVVPVFDRVETFQPKNRSVEFMAAVINAAFGSPFARPAGRQLVLSVPKDRFDAVVTLAQDLDQAPKTVEVSASFVEVSRTSNSARGVSLVASVLSRRFAVSVQPGAGSVGVYGGSYQLVLDALDADGRFKQVSNSRVVGDESEHMSLTVGDETPTISSTGKDNQGNALQSIVYRPSGVILDVLPKVMGSGKLSLVVDGQVSSFQSTVNGVSGSPTLVKRQVKTSVSVGDGQVLVIGGLDDSKVISNNAGFSFLPSAWRNKTANDSRTDLVLILSAMVLDKPAPLGVAP